MDTRTQAEKDEQTARNIAAFERGKAAGLSEDEPIDPHYERKV